MNKPVLKIRYIYFFQLVHYLILTFDINNLKVQVIKAIVII